MSSKNKYICKSCEYKTDSFAKIKRHLFNGKRCIPLLNDYYKYSNEQCIILSLIPHDKDNKQNIDINNLKKYNKICSYYDLLNERLLNKDMRKNKCCSYCKKNFNSCVELRNHILLECFDNEINDLENKKIENNINKTDLNMENSNINNNSTVDNHSTTGKKV